MKISYTNKCEAGQEGRPILGGLLTTRTYIALVTKYSISWHCLLRQKTSSSYSSVVNVRKDYHTAKLHSISTLSLMP